MTRLAIAAFSLIVFLAAAGPAAPAAKKRGEIKLDLTSIVLDQPIVIDCIRYSVVRVTGVINDEGGKGEVTLDLNTFFFNEFGDITGGTQIAVRSVKVQFTRVLADDPAGRHRRMYRVVGEGLPAPMYLIVPAKGDASYRLLVNPESKPGTDPFITGKYFDRVIPLERRPETN